MSMSRWEAAHILDEMANREGRGASDYYAQTDFMKGEADKRRTALRLAIETLEAAAAVVHLVEHDYINYGGWDAPNTKVEHRPTEREPHVPCRRCNLEAALAERSDAAPKVRP